MSQIVIIAHDIRSAHNVGSLLRTAEGLGAYVYLTGYTPYPTTAHETRLPHIHQKLTRQIHKTALGAEVSSMWQHEPDINVVISTLRQQGYSILALEQTAGAVPLPTYKTESKVAVVLGREVEGISTEVLSQTDAAVVIPMHGSKESFNVVQSAAMALYHFTFHMLAEDDKNIVK